MLSAKHVLIFQSWLVFVVGGVAQSVLAGECPVTTGSKNLLGKPFPRSGEWYGSEALAVRLPGGGIWWGMGPEKNYRDKLSWWSLSYQDSREPELKVSGRRLDASSAKADVSASTGMYSEDSGGWLMLVLVEFPSSGCWEVTGEFLGQSLDFVVRVPEKEKWEEHQKSVREYVQSTKSK